MRRTLTISLALVLCAAVPFAAWAARPEKPAPAVHVHPAMTAKPAPNGLAPLLAKARLATAKYATSLQAARRAGYTVNVTRSMPNMGWHFLNPKITGFDISKPPILVYVKRGTTWQLVAFEWVFAKKPAKAPLPGATYGSFAAACHYADGTLGAATAEADCTKTSPETGAAFGFWHPDFVTLPVLASYPNPGGSDAPTNPRVQAMHSERTP